MKVNPLPSPSREQRTTSLKKGSGKDFSSSMDMANNKHAEKELRDLMERINKLGEDLKDKPNLDGIREYKKRIKEYLSYILKHYYKISPNYGRYSNQVLLRVEVINSKIEELIDAFLQQQKGTIDIINRIDEISGLLVDLYN